MDDLQFGTREPARIQFGSREDDTMPAPWAERLIRWLHDERPAVFMDGMWQVFGLDQPEKRRRNP